LGYARTVTDSPLTVVSLESRRSEELARLLQRHGCVAIEAPSLREVPLDDQRDAFAFGEALLRGECDLLVLLTGVGARALLKALATRWPEATVMDALRGVKLVCRGPKPVAFLKEIGLKPSITAEEPNTWREVLSSLASFELGGARVWVQEYGKPNPALVDALRARGATVSSAAVYAWQLPEDLEPLRRAVCVLCEGKAEAILVTSGRQVDHLIEVAGQLGKADALLVVLRERVLVCSIGPVTSESLQEHGLGADLEPEHPKMGHLVKEVAARGPGLLARKRAAA
jgi:uroporphyrinogen-III synthase